MLRNVRTWIILGLALVVAAAFFVWSASGPDPSQFAYLAQPRIAHVDDQRMLVVEAVGDPNLVSGRAFKLLFAAYYKTDGVSRMQKPPAPRARWSFSSDTSRDKWAGRYGLPISPGVNMPSSLQSEDGLKVGIETWEYGEVAEVLHVGPYSDERPDIERLHRFVTASGYRAVGDHEEEYVCGPGVIFRGDPNEYLTIIRLRVVSAGIQPPIE